MEHAIETHGLSKRYKGGVHALRETTLSIRSGSCFGLLGPNGAGKSTLVKTLLSIVRATSGKASMLGKDIRDSSARQGVGYLPEGLMLPAYLTGLAACRYLGRLGGMSGKTLRDECDEKLELVGLADRKKDRVTKYSKGMKQRLGLAQALMGDPQLVFLDEPTDGVDPIGRQEIRQVVRQSCERGTTFLINSHILSEIEEVCDEVAIMKLGEILASGTVSDITQQVTSSGGLSVRIRTGDLPHELWHSLTGRGAEALPDSFFQIALGNEDEVTGIIDELRRYRVPIYAVTPIQASLEDAFIQLITADPDSENEEQSS